MPRLPFWLALGVPLAACVPPGNSTPSTNDAGAATAANAPAAPTFRPSPNALTTTFEDDFDRPATPSHPAEHDAGVAPAPASASATAAKGDGGEAGAPTATASASGSAHPAAEPEPVAPSNLGPNWYATDPRAWRIDDGRLCGQKAHNHGVWLTKTLPVNARIEFDAISESPDGDLKAEVFGDGHSFAKGTSYNDATSYLVILGGWKNTTHAIARLDEHKNEGPGARDTIEVDLKSDDPRQRPVVPGQVYHFKIERADGKTLRWWIGEVEMLSYPDPQPLAGIGHDHFGFNDWEARVCFDNVKVTPLP